MKNLKMIKIIIASFFIMSWAFASDDCQSNKDLASEVSEKSNASLVLEAASIMMGLETNEASVLEDDSEMNLPKSVYNSSRVSDI